MLLLLGCSNSEHQQSEELHQHVIEDAVSQYEAIKNSSDQLEVCVYAGMVTEAYQQAKMQKEASKWKVIEDADCKKAGIPMQ